MTDIVSTQRLFWYGGIIAAIVGLAWLIFQMFQKGEQPPEGSKESNYIKKFLTTIWSVFIFVFIVTLILAGKSSTKRELYFSFLYSFFIPLFLASLETQMIKKLKFDKSKPLSFFIPIPLVGIGLSLLFIGFVINFYNVNSHNLWTSFVIGSFLALFLIRISANIISYRRYEVIFEKVESIFMLINGVIVSLLFAGFHFGKVSYDPATYLPPLLLMLIYLVLLISTIPWGFKDGDKIMKILPSQITVYLALFLGITLFLILKFNIKFKYNYPIITGAITSIIFIIMMYGSASKKSNNIDLSAGAMGILVVLGGLWSSYKWGMGYGMSLYTVGLLSVIPLLATYRGLESYVLLSGTLTDTTPNVPSANDVLFTGNEEEKANNEENKTKFKNIWAEDVEKKFTWGEIFLRAISLLAIPPILLELYLLFVQQSSLLKYGLDISYGDTVVALLLGVVLSIVFEGFYLSGDNALSPKRDSSIKEGIVIFGAGIFIALIVFLTIGVLFNIDGIGAFMIGMMVSSLIGAFSFLAQKQERGIFRAALYPLWATLIAFSVYLLKYQNSLYHLTRLHKQQILVGVILLIIITYFIAQRKQKGKNGGNPPQEQDTEKNLKVKTIE